MKITGLFDNRSVGPLGHDAVLLLTHNATNHLFNLTRPSRRAFSFLEATT
jgi:hypothetical protein